MVCASGRILDVEADRLCGGGVGKALGAMGWVWSVIGYVFWGVGENGGVGVSECRPPDCRGVECRESMMASPKRPPVPGVSGPTRPLLRGPLRDGVALAPGGTTMSASGWMPGLGSPLILLVRLSVRRSRSDFSQRTAPALASCPPAELDPEAESGGWEESVEALEVSMLRAGGGAARVRWRSSSTQLAGVGGTGPRAAIPCGGGLRVGGETMGSGVLFRLCDLEVEGGGPGGGGGTVMLCPQPVCDAERERAETGVSTALADAARLALGGTASGSVSMLSILAVGI